MFKIIKIVSIALSITLSPILLWGVGQGTETVPAGYSTEGIVHTPSLEVNVWVDRGSGAVYHPGDNIKVYFKTSQDCYLVVYGIDTRGDVNILYPYDETDAPWVEGGKTYRIPDKNDNYDLRIDGPKGTEYIRAVASLDPFALPNWPRYSGKSEVEKIETLKMNGDEDPFEFMQMVDCNLVPYCDDYSSDLATLQVEYRYPDWYYYPETYCLYYPWRCQLGAAYFICEPFGVEVWIDGIYYGITPITIPYLLVGRHYICYYYSGCWVWRDYVYVEKGHTINVKGDIGSKYRYVNNYVIEKDYRTKTKEYRAVGGKTYENVKAKVEEKSLKTKDQERVMVRDRQSIDRASPEKTYKEKAERNEYQQRKDKPVETKINTQSENREKIKQVEQASETEKPRQEYNKVKQEKMEPRRDKGEKQGSTIKPESKPEKKEERVIRTENTGSREIKNSDMNRTGRRK
jgi:hypothetical protein